MNEQHFKLVSSRARMWKLVAGAVIVIGMLPIWFVVSAAIEWRRQGLSDWGETWWPVGLIVSLIGIAGAVYLSYFYGSQLTLSSQRNSGLQLVVRDPNGSEMGATGTWKWRTYQTRQYTRYGVRWREQYLVLYTSGKAFVVFCENAGVTGDPPDVYKLAPREFLVGVPVYTTTEIDKILEIVQNSEGAEQVGSGTNTATANS